MPYYKVDLNCYEQRFTSCLRQAITLFTIVSVMAFFSLSTLAADGTFSLGGFTEIVSNDPALGHPRAFQVPSTCAGECLRGAPFGELTTASVIYLPDRTMRFKDLHTLSTDFRRWTGDCGGGSPRFEIALDTNGDGETNGRIFVYLGPLYDFTNCSRTWENTGNFIAFGGDYRWDLTQLGGLFYDSYRDASSRFGEAIIDYIILVVDGSWYPNLIYSPNDPNKQIFQFDRVRVNNDIYNANQAGNSTKAEIPSIARLRLEEYVTGISGPRNLFGPDSYLARRYSLRSLFRILGWSRTNSLRISRY
jgi:hypothetical protein